MELIRGLHNIKPRHRTTAVTIGNFDGIHRGHVKLLQILKQKALDLGVKSTVITFEPYPLELFLQKKAQPRLMRLREKLPLIEQFEIDQVLCIRFTHQFAQIAADQFIEHILLKKLDVRYMIVGEDFRFGHKRQGNVKLLKQYSDQSHFQLEIMKPLLMNGQRVSSTLIREKLQKGDLTAAERYLGRPFFMSGRIVHGDKLGHKLGFPTANIYLHRKVVPITGVYAVRVYGLNDMPYKGVANVGNRPAVNGKRCILEVYIFNFQDYIYGRHVSVEFLHRIRDEINFDSLDQLKEKIQQDVIEAQAFFRQEKATMEGD